MLKPFLILDHLVFLYWSNCTFWSSFKLILQEKTAQMSWNYKEEVLVCITKMHRLQGHYEQIQFLSISQDFLKLNLLHFLTIVSHKESSAKYNPKNLHPWSFKKSLFWILLALICLSWVSESILTQRNGIQLEIGVRVIF